VDNGASVEPNGAPRFIAGRFIGGQLFDMVLTIDKH